MVFADVVEKLMVRTEVCVRYVIETLGRINQILLYRIYFALIESDVFICCVLMVGCANMGVAKLYLSVIGIM